MVRAGVHVVIGVSTVVLLQLVVVMVMASSSGVPDEYLPSDQLNKESLVTADYADGLRGPGSLCAMANITNHPNSTTVPHEHVWMGILDVGGLADLFYTRLVSLGWLCILVMGSFKWRPRRWTPPHVLIVVATVNAAMASLFFSVANVAALFAACVGLIMLAANWHFVLLECAAMSLAYWCSALWIGWTMWPLVGVSLAVLAVAMRWSFLLFPDIKVYVTYNLVRRPFRVGDDCTIGKFEEDVARSFRVLGELFFSVTDDDGDDVELSRSLKLTAGAEYNLRVAVGACPHYFSSSHSAQADVQTVSRPN
jgi:hypothetical protein